MSTAAGGRRRSRPWFESLVVVVSALPRTAGAGPGWCILPGTHEP